ncbi:MAG TPA: DMT family transporter [Candidatus Angelobacter sp.]|nr:DMT family transporter [Candidatus Angelobacter sp.]
MSGPARPEDAPPSRAWLLPAAFLLLGAIWGSSFAWIKIAVEEIPPATLVAWRMTLGAAGMGILLLAWRLPLPRRLGELAPLAVMGAINAAIPIFLISWGEQYVDSGTAAVLNSLVPIFSLILAGLALKTEPVTMLRVIGLVLGFVGAALLAGRELELRTDASGLLGALAVVLAAVSYAAGASFAKHRIRHAHRYVVAGGTLVFAAIYMWLLAIPADGGIIVPAEPSTLLAVAWLGILGSFVAYLLFFFLIEHLGATMASMVTYMFPVIGVGIGVLLLNELMDPRLAIGTALVVLGIVIVTLRYDAGVSRVPGGARE